MKKKLIRITVIFLATVLLFYFNGGINILGLNKTAFAVGDLTIDWGVPSGDPIFVVNNMMPGDLEQRDVKVKNEATTNRPVGVRGIKTSETGGISGVLIIEIKEGATTLYGPKTLSEFFTDSSGPSGIPLSDLDPSEQTSYKFMVTLPFDAGNQYQGKSVIFDLQIGISFDVPAECQTAAGTSWNPIFGTSGDDNITGTRNNDIILGLEGNDKIEGGNGRDCIIGGEGDDRLHGNNNADVILGNEGDDKLFGNNGNDRLFGGLGEDEARGGNGTDTCDAEVEQNCEL